MPLPSHIQSGGSSVAVMACARWRSCSTAVLYTRPHHALADMAQKVAYLSNSHQVLKSLRYGSTDP